MKPLLVPLFLIITISGFAQFDRSASLSATGNFNIALSGLGVDDAGLGLNLEAALFFRHRLQAIVEGGLDHFLGDKALYFDSAKGRAAKTNIYSIKAGAQFFFTKHLALAATYGPAWYVVRDFDYKMSYGVRYSVTGFLGDRRRLMGKAFMVSIPAAEHKLQYLGFAVGYRFGKVLAQTRCL